MDILFAFLPFVAFAVVAHLVGPTEALIAGTVLAALVAARTKFAGRSPKILEVGAVVMFAALTAYQVSTAADMTLLTAKLFVDVGMLAIVVVSMLVGKPFTMQYAKETVPQEYWGTPQFVRKNYEITGVWALAFLVIVAAEAALDFVPGVPRGIATAVVVVALVFAVKYTKRATDDAPGKPR